MVQVHCDEGVAIRIGPKPCVRGREAADEASAGERTGQPLSPVMSLSRVPTVSKDRKATRPCAPARAHGRPGGVVDPGMCGSLLPGNREISRPTTGRRGRLVRIGKARSRSR
jgi:hypothetical protein